MGARRLVALLTSNGSLGDDYQGALRRGVERACATHDVDLWVYAGRNNWTRWDEQHRLFGCLHPSRVHGIVIAAGVIESYTPLAGVIATIRAACSVPTCAVAQVVHGMPSFLIDNASAAAQAALHLFKEHGRRRFVYIAGPAGHEESDARLRGVRSALAGHGLTLDERSVAHSDFGHVGGRRALAELLARQPELDAVLAANDHMALGAIEGLLAAGRRVPDEIAVAGFDDAASARFGVIPLTTVRQPVMRLGVSAVGAIVEAWAGREAAPITTLDTELVVRESCGCPAAGLALGRQSVALSSPPGSEAALVRSLGPVLDDQAERTLWAKTLLAAVGDERAGQLGAVHAAFAQLGEEPSVLQASLHEAQRVITMLRAHAVADGGAAIEEGFHAARVMVASLTYRRAGEQHLCNERILEELRESCERLATCLKLDDLRMALIHELPRLGIQNGFVALVSAEHGSRLKPFMCLKDGLSVALPGDEYEAHLVTVEGAFGPDRRRSLTIFPLTFESELLGIAAFELPLGTEAYALLREQIGSSIKVAELHQARMNKEREHVEAQQAQRATADRLRSLGVIAGGVAHDLNNALGPLLALPDTIQRELSRARIDVPREVLDDLAAIHQSGLRAAHTIRDLFVLGQENQEPKRRLDLCRLLRSEADTFRRLCDRPTIDLVVETPSEPLVVHASAPHLVRVLSNLVLNAVDAIPEAGTITVRARARSLARAVDGIERVEPGDYAVIEVEDTGLGIPPDHLPRILEPFFTARLRKGGAGTGLGLAIVHRLVKDTRGYLDVKSTVGVGTSFSLYFPRQREAVTASSRPNAVVAGGSERILVIDDEPIQLRTAKRILTHLGYAVETAQSGEEGIDMCSAASQSPSFDLLIVDMVMPGGLNGLATVAQIRRRLPRQKALIASGYAPDPMSAAAQQRGLPWLAKPYTLNGLATAVRKTLDTRAGARASH
jgi:DNA-binding LacI/PurR family transcriptional regulator/signal transduction histidine kinase/ActR/RegA family two-component response regulator